MGSTDRHGNGAAHPTPLAIARGRLRRTEWHTGPL